MFSRKGTATLLNHFNSTASCTTLSNRVNNTKNNSFLHNQRVIFQTVTIVNIIREVPFSNTIRDTQTILTGFS